MGRSSGITIAGAKYSSEDSAVLVQYTIAIVEYTRRCGPLKAAMERMHELEREIEENERMQKLAEEEVRKISYEFDTTHFFYPLWNKFVLLDFAPHNLICHLERLIFIIQDMLLILKKLVTCLLMRDMHNLMYLTALTLCKCSHALSVILCG